MLFLFRLIRKFVAAVVACVLLVCVSSCSLLVGAVGGARLDRDALLDDYNTVVGALGETALSGEASLSGERSFGADRYVGTYTADYRAFTGKEILFGGAFVRRAAGKRLTVTCTFEAEAGTAQLLWRCGSDDPAVLLSGAGTYSETVEMEEGGNYFFVAGDGFTGTVSLSIADAAE